MIGEYELSQDRVNELFLVKSFSNSCYTHFHRKVELLYILNGSMNITINNQKYTLTKDNLAICDSYDFHAYDKSEDNGRQAVILFPQKMLDKYFDYMKDKVLLANIVFDEEFCKAVQPLFEEITTNKSASAYVLQAKSDLLLSLIVEKVGTKPREITAQYSFIESILQYISQNLCDEINLSKLANYFGYSKYYFSRLFNANFKTNINDYISILRLQKTLEMLKKDKCSTTHAALSCGFSSMKTFYRVLKKNYGDVKL